MKALETSRCCYGVKIFLIKNITGAETDLFSTALEALNDTIYFFTETFGRAVSATAGK